MKKALHVLHVITLLLILSGGAQGQNFLQVTQSDIQHPIRISQDQALEVRLPSTPSTGFGWYATNNNADILKQVGNWEFVSDNPSSDVEGASGTQVTHFVSVAAGTTELELLYRRPWEDVSQATSSYKITIVSEGAYTGKEVKPYVPAEVAVDNGESTRALPAAFSWQAQNTPVKNQASCGSCWTFASSAAFETVINIWDKKVLDLSEQWLVNCDNGSNGCSGGTFAFKMFINNGAVYEVDEPYKAKDGTCKSTYPYHEKAKSSGTVTNNLAAIKQALLDYGPMYVSVCAGTNFSNYKSGILTQTDGTSTNHAVLLSGWDDNGGTNGYWIIKNSWGSSYGEKGYLRAKYGISGLGQKVGWVNYKGVIPYTPTGVTDITSTNLINVSPNPSNGIFQFDGLENENKIEVYDFVGNLVYQTVSNSTSVSVDLKEKTQGMYIYKVINTPTNGIKTGKLMVY